MTVPSIVVISFTTSPVHSVWRHTKIRLARRGGLPVNVNRFNTPVTDNGIMHRIFLALLLAVLLAGATSALDLSWSDTGEAETPPFSLFPGLAYLSISSPGGVYVQLLDGAGETVGTGLLLEAGNGESSMACVIGDAGDYSLSINGDREWTVTLTDPPVDEEPGTGWTDVGVKSTGLFPLDAGTVLFSLKSEGGAASAELFDAGGRTLASVFVKRDAPEAAKEVSIPARGLYLINVEGPVLYDAWTVAIEPLQGPTPSPTLAPGGTTYAEVRTRYVAAARAWGQAWGASDPAVIRLFLRQARGAYTTCLETANAVNDPGNAANLALARSVSTVYIDLADAAIDIYDGADAFGAGQSQMNAGDYASAAATFEAAAGTFDSSRSLFGRATSTLQTVVYAGTEFGDGTAYTAAIVPILDAKATYMGEFAAYARGWRHTSLAYAAGLNGDTATFRSEAMQAMTLFDALRATPSFGADASTNYGVLASRLGTSPVPDKKAR